MSSYNRVKTSPFINDRGSSWSQASWSEFLCRKKAENLQSVVPEKNTICYQVFLRTLFVGFSITFKWYLYKTCTETSILFCCCAVNGYPCWSTLHKDANNPTYQMVLAKAPNGEPETKVLSHWFRYAENEICVMFWNCAMRAWRGQ